MQDVFVGVSNGSTGVAWNAGPSRRMNGAVIIAAASHRAAHKCYMLPICVRWLLQERPGAVARQGPWPWSDLGKHVTRRTSWQRET
jgi:hypothetical protein